MSYSYDFFMDINKKNSFELDINLIEVLDNLCKIVNNNYGLTYYEKNYKNKNRRGNKHFNNHNNNNSQWRLKKTIIKKDINSDIDKYKYEINSLLNKLSKNNFDSISKKIIEYYKKDNLTSDDLNTFNIFH